MFEFLKLRYAMGKISAAQLQSLVPTRLTQSQCETILAMESGAK